MGRCEAGRVLWRSSGELVSHEVVRDDGGNGEGISGGGLRVDNLIHKLT